VSDIGGRATARNIFSLPRPELRGLAAIARAEMGRVAANARGAVRG